MCTEVLIVSQACLEVLIFCKTSSPTLSMVERLVSPFEPESYAGRSFSSWYGHPSRTGLKGRGQTKGTTWPSRLGVGRWASHPTL